MSLLISLRKSENILFGIFGEPDGHQSQKTGPGSAFVFYHHAICPLVILCNFIQHVVAAQRVDHGGINSAEELSDAHLFSWLY